MIAERDLFSELPKLPFNWNKARIGVEAAFLTLKNLNKLKDLLPQSNFISTENIVESFTMIKDNDEISKIKKAVRIAEKAFGDIIKKIKPGMKEKDIALDLEYKMRAFGADGPAFDTIVASGQRSSMPHGRASEKKLRKGEFVTIDFGCFYQGYASDITRTLVLGKANEKQKKVYNIVLSAQKAACKAIRPRIGGSEVDNVARDIIAKAGYGDNFGHGLGHGIGLLVHDGPVLSPRSNDTLSPGNVVTVEPGIYIHNWGGVRIEDDVLVTPNGGQILTKLPKELIEL
jgi:Xaa-Pro aminopeptidase